MEMHVVKFMYTELYGEPDIKYIPLLSDRYSAVQELFTFIESGVLLPLDFRFSQPRP
jgi:hypothetical protein